MTPKLKLIVWLVAGCLIALMALVVLQERQIHTLNEKVDLIASANRTQDQILGKLVDRLYEQDSK